MDQWKTKKEKNLKSNKKKNLWKTSSFYFLKNGKIPNLCAKKKTSHVKNYPDLKEEEQEIKKYDKITSSRPY